MNELIPAVYNEVRHEIRDADLLLFRRRNRLGRLISVGGRSQYVHAAMAGWWNDRLMCVEMTSGGGRAQLLSNLVARWPGVIDVYAIQKGREKGRAFSRKRALKVMIGITGIDYGWINLLRAALLHLPLLRFLVRPEENDDGKNQKSEVATAAPPSSFPPFCSQAVSAAMRAGGIDPVPNLTDRLTEPGDLARSAVYQYRFTLVPGEK
jgi:hypothetical protein